MTGDADEARTLRRRLDALTPVGRPDATPAAPTMLVVTVTVSSYPATAQAGYGVRRVVVGGTEAEGATPTFTAVGPTFFAFNAGATVPANGTKVLATLVGPRWVFRWDS